MHCPNCKQQVSIPAPKQSEDLIVYELREETTAATGATAPTRPVPPPVQEAQLETFALRTSEPQRPVTTPDIHPLPEPPEESFDSSAPGRGLYCLFALMLIPLAISILHGKDHVVERLQRTLQSHPEIKSRMEQDDQEFSKKDFFEVLPEGKIEGAHLPYNTWVHWLYALASTVLFGIALYALFPTGNADWKQVALIGLSTATLGIVFLISVQWIAEVSQGFVMFRGGIIMIFFYIIAFIGFSYRAAMDPEAGFWLSMLGFTFGVGLCEELTKVLPVIFHFRSKATLDWRGACLWGLGCGVGFGIAEGIMYSSDFYNGLAGGETYIVRFITCVAMHAIWTAAAAIMIWRRRSWFENDWEWGDFLVTVLWVLAVPMTLHGLYDTLLKRDMEVFAVLTALASFGWLIFVIEWTRATDNAI